MSLNIGKMDKRDRVKVWWIIAFSIAAIISIYLWNATHPIQNNLKFWIEKEKCLEYDKVFTDNGTFIKCEFTSYGEGLDEDGFQNMLCNFNCELNEDKTEWNCETIALRCVYKVRGLERINKYRKEKV